MLHELLLALSGHPSPLFSDKASELSSNLSPAELGLLKQLAYLGELHQDTRSLASQIGESHESIICRAVAVSITNIQLAAFQRKILDVEQGILSKDQTYVGAYDIVPLSGISTAFAGWNRKLRWLKQACEKMRGGTSGAGTINWLRTESRTGFPDIEAIVLDLVQVAETTWLRQLSTWIFYGRLQTNGAQDFLIQADGERKGFAIHQRLCPEFVTPAMANSILFIGRSLHHIKRIEKTPSDMEVLKNVAAHTQHMTALSTISHPIMGTALARVVANIRTSLARNALRELLPTTEIMKLLKVLQEFFLLARGEFCVALVTSADQVMQSRSTKTVQVIDPARLGNAMIKPTEVSSVLNQTWAILASLQDINDDSVDEILEEARELITLHTTSNGTKKNDKKINERSIFNDALLSVPTTLSISVPSPLDLFFTHQEAEIYSMIHAYLLSIRRTHLHLTELWKLSVLRRRHGIHGIRYSIQDTTQNNEMRFVWAAVSATTTFLTELSEYLQGEVIANSWSAFELWLQKDTEERDPEVLKQAHNMLLKNLLRLLILEDVRFPSALKALLSQCDRAVTFIQSLDNLRQTIQAFRSHGTESANVPAHLSEDEQRVMQDLMVIARSMNLSLKDIALLLNRMEAERTGSVFETMSLGEHMPQNDTNFVPWKGAGIKSLLMRLDLRMILDE